MSSKLKNPNPTVNTRLISLSSFAALLLLMSFCRPADLQGAGSRYIAFFSAEQEDFRRLLFDGIGNRQLAVDMDSLGRVEVTILGVSEDEYVGRRHYASGSYIPVNIDVDFPRKHVMVIGISGFRFAEIVGYRVMESDIYVLDLYTNPLPEESFFREKSLNALWPAGRFEPDIFPDAESASPSTAKARSTVLRHINVQGLWGRLAPYKALLQRAILWAGTVSGAIFLLALPIIWVARKRQARRGIPGAVVRAAAQEGGKRIPPSLNLHDVIRENSDLSYDEVTLMASLEREKEVAGAGKA